MSQSPMKILLINIKNRISIFEGEMLFAYKNNVVTEMRKDDRDGKIRDLFIKLDKYVLDVKPLVHAVVVQVPMYYQIYETPTLTQKNGEARFSSSDVSAYLDVAELTTMVDDMKKQSQERVPTIRILVQYENFFKRRMSNVKQMVRACEARVEELRATAIEEEYARDWNAIQFVKPKMMR